MLTVLHDLLAGAYAGSAMFKFIGRILKGVWSCVDFTRRALANLILIALVCTVLVAVFWNQPTAIPAKSLLEINLAGNLVEQSSMSGREAVFARTLQGADPETRLRDVVRSLELAAADPDIEGVYMRVDDLSRAGLASLREVGAAMDRFKASGKKITVWASTFSQMQYAIAAHASEVYVHPMGQVNLKGLASNRLYWGDALRKAGVTVHVFKAGAYKTFPEIYVLGGPSEESLLADRYWLNDAWFQLTENIQTARGLMPDAVDTLIATLPGQLRRADGDMSRVAFENSLIDGVRSGDDVLDMLVERQGGKKGSDKLRQVGYLDYLTVRDRMPSSGAGVGVITLEGDIRDGEGGLGSIGARSAARLIRKAKGDDSIVALVVRVDSPGGSAVASEMIRRELERVRAAGKPVVISMGDYAASGGYWLSLAADHIVADPMSITGSIGVFGMLPTFEGTLSKFGVGSGGVATTWLADTENLTKPINPMFEGMMELTVGRTYKDFISLVARARNLPVDRVQALAQGRVYTGRQAQSAGLVDSIGGMTEALNQAAQLAKIDGVAPIYWIEEEPGSLEVLLGQLAVQMQSMFAESAVSWIPSSVRMSAMATQEVQSLSQLVKTPGESITHCLCTPQ